MQPDGVRLEELWGRDNRISVSGWAERPFQADCGARTLTGGAGLSIGAGVMSLVRVDAADRSYCRGSVVLSDGSPVDRGVVLLVVLEADETGEADPFGRRFSVQL